MKTILIRGAKTLLTMNDTRQEISDADLRMCGGVTVEIGQSLTVG